MKIQTMKRKVRLREWAAQINACRESGMTVRQWCECEGINSKTYYNHVRLVREEMLELIDSSDTRLTASQRAHEPVFAEIKPVPMKPVAATVRCGKYEIDIHNIADSSLVEHVIRTVACL